MGKLSQQILITNLAHSYARFKNNILKSDFEIEVYTQFLSVEFESEFFISEYNLSFLSRIVSQIIETKIIPKAKRLAPI